VEGGRTGLELPRHGSGDVHSGFAAGSGFGRDWVAGGGRGGGGGAVGEEGRVEVARAHRNAGELGAEAAMAGSARTRRRRRSWGQSRGSKGDTGGVYSWLGWPLGAAVGADAAGRCNTPGVMAQLNLNLLHFTMSIICLFCIHPSTLGTLCMISNREVHASFENDFKNILLGDKLLAKHRFVKLFWFSTLLKVSSSCASGSDESLGQAVLRPSSSCPTSSTIGT
jgi:hypothetical protein